ncbi:hypothetical protein B566_EDAN013329 [Ephemera danica]|nr:hypothetical protein B566_EDAN013329 [Ephemera danica]
MFTGCWDTKQAPVSGATPGALEIVQTAYCVGYNISVCLLKLSYRYVHWLLRCVTYKISRKISLPEKEGPATREASMSSSENICRKQQTGTRRNEGCFVKAPPQGKATTTSKRTDRKRAPQATRISKTTTSSESQTTLDTFVKKSIISIAMTLEKLESACLEMVTVRGRPISALDDSGFKKILKPILEVLPGKPSLRSAQVSKMIHERTKSVRENIKMIFQSKLVSLKLDAVTRLNRKFLVLNVQEIVDGKLELFCLGVIEAPAQHTGEYLCTELIKVLETYEISIEQIYSVTVYNGRNMLKMALPNITFTSEKETENDSDNPKKLEILDDSNEVLLAQNNELLETLTDTCTKHTLQHAVTDAITAVIDKKEDPNSIFKNIRRAIKKLRTPNYGPKLKRCNLRHNEEEYPELHLSENEWNEVEATAAALLPAKIATDRLQAEQLSIGDTFLIWHTCLLATQLIKHPLAQKLVKNLDERGRTVFKNKVVCAALYLDPRFHCILKPIQKEAAINHLGTASDEYNSEGDEANKNEDTNETETSKSADSLYTTLLVEEQRAHLAKNKRG